MTVRPILPRNQSFQLVRPSLGQLDRSPKPSIYWSYQSKFRHPEAAALLRGPRRTHGRGAATTVLVAPPRPSALRGSRERREHLRVTEHRCSDSMRSKSALAGDPGRNRTCDLQLFARTAKDRPGERDRAAAPPGVRVIDQYQAMLPQVTSWGHRGRRPTGRTACSKPGSFSGPH
jgi:hypothetical protein